MRSVAICLLALGLALAAASPAAAAKRWPTAADVRAAEPGIASAHVGCMVAGLRKRHLTARVYRRELWDLSPRQKRVLAVTRHLCMSEGEREGAVRRSLGAAFGSAASQLVSEIECTAKAWDALPLADLQQVSDNAGELRLLTRLARRCKLLGAAAKVIAEPLGLQPSHDEVACLNQHGALRPPTAPAARRVAVFDRCIGRASAEAMYERLLERAGVKHREAVCAAPALARKLTFVQLFAGAPEVRAAMAKAVSSCSPN